MNILLFLVASLVICSTTLSIAQENESTPVWEEDIELQHELRFLRLEGFLELELNVASTKAETSLQSPSTVTVIDRKMIEEHNFTSIASAVQTLAGIQVYRTAFKQQIPTVRGLLQDHYANKVLVMINNIPSWHAVTGEGNLDRVSIHDIEGAKAIVKKLDSLADIVIVSFHGGAEGKDHQHLTREKESYYGEDRGNVYEFSHSLVDAGADVIFGHGPHVTRAIEVYNDRFIAYSLGNFCTYARFNLSGPNGIAPIVRVNMLKDGTFIGGKIYPIRQVGSGMPIIDKDKSAIFKIKELTHIDIPETKIDIDDNGNINYLKQDF